MKILRGFFFLVVIGFAFAYWMATRPPQSNELESSQKLEFSLQDIKKKMVSLQTYKGRPVLLNFWASWCPPCIEELPSLLEFSNWAKEQFQLQTIAVSVDEAWEPILKLFEKIKWDSQKTSSIIFLINPDAQTAKQYGVTKYPETYLINKDFKIVHRFIGPQDWMTKEMHQWFIKNLK